MKRKKSPKLSRSRSVAALNRLGRRTNRVAPVHRNLRLESLDQRIVFASYVNVAIVEAITPDIVMDTPANIQNLDVGDAAPDLVQFAKDLAAAGVSFYGAHWCPACTEQKELFSDGRDNLPFIEVTKPDQSLNDIATAKGITQIPTWDFPSGQRLTGVQTLQGLSTASGVPIPSLDQPTFEAIGDLTVRTGSPLHVPIDAYDPGEGPLTTTVTVANPSLLTATVLTGNRSLLLNMSGYGDMVFELFEQRAPVATGRVADLADEGFYDGIIFHRVVDDFVIQAGDPTGTGIGGSTKGDFDDNYHPDLQHNTEGVLSFAKSSDDTNDSQLFVTEVPTRFLDFNHSVFGQLVEGFDVREAISETEVNNSSTNRPTNTVTIDSASVFSDAENSVVMLKPVSNATGTTTVTITVTDADGNTFSETVTVTVAADDSNSQPFLYDITTPAAADGGQAAQLQLSSIDVEGDAVTYFATSSSTNASTSVDATTGLVTVTPNAGFIGTVDVNVGVRPGTGVTGNGSSDSDNQRVTFTFSSAAMDLILNKEVNLAYAVSGEDSLVYTFTINHGVESFSDATNIRFTDRLPAGLSDVRINSPAATTSSFADGIITVEFASILIGESRTFNVTASIQANVTGSIINVATVTSDGLDLNETNNTDTVTTVVVGSGLQNPVLFGDVNADGIVTVLDALLIINRLARDGSQPDIPVSAGDRGPNFFDVNGDRSISALDGLEVINRLARRASTINQNNNLLAGEAEFADDVIVAPVKDKLASSRGVPEPRINVRFDTSSVSGIRPKLTDWTLLTEMIDDDLIDLLADDFLEEK